MYQKLTIVGNLGRDPEMRYTSSGQAVTSFSVATTHEYNTADGQHVKETTWFRVSVWGKMGEACNTYLKKGSRVLVDGRIVPDKETGAPRLFQKKDGSWSSSFDVTASAVKFLSEARNEGSSPFDGNEEIG